jgi:hypothetical protein
MQVIQADARASTGFSRSASEHNLNRRRARLPLAPIALALACALPGAHAQDKWGPHVDLEAKPGSKRSLGEADLFLPLSQDARTLWFANIRTRFDNRDGYEGNLGLGVRRMLENGWNLGAYAYADRRRSDLGNTYDQATVGLEALGRDFELRANVYTPVGTRARDIGATSTASLSGASVQVSTAFREERALKGYDAEAGWRVPIWDAEAHRQLRIYLGGYRFADAGISVNGPRARVEFAVQDLPWFEGRSSLFVGAETQHDSARGTNNFAYVRLRIPLGKSGGASPRLSAQERRMTAPVVRDIDIVTQSHTRATLNETASATANGQPLTVLDAGSTSGAALPGAVAAAGANSTVVLTGTFNTTVQTALQPGQTLMGAGSLAVRTPSGYTAAVRLPGATINSTIAGGTEASIVMANNSTLRGMVINHSWAHINVNGVWGNNVSGASVLDSVITTGNPAAGVTSSQAIIFLNSSNITVSGNTITATASGGGIVTALQFASTSGLISNNSLSATGGSPRYLWLNDVGTDVNIQSGSTGNTRGGGSCIAAGTTIGSVGFTNGTTCP